MSLSKLSNKGNERTASETSREEEESYGSGGCIISILIHIAVLIHFYLSSQGEFGFWTRLFLGAFVIKLLIERVELAIQDEKPCCANC